MTHYASATTLSLVSAAKPSQDLRKRILDAFGKKRADKTPVDLATILDRLGFQDALWVLSYAMPDSKLARHFQAWCAEQVFPIYDWAYPDDTRVRGQIAMLRNDDADEEARSVAMHASWAAARHAHINGPSNAAAAATWTAVCDASRDAAIAIAEVAESKFLGTATGSYQDKEEKRLAVWRSARAEALVAQEKKLREMLEL